MYYFQLDSYMESWQNQEDVYNITTTKIGFKVMQSKGVQVIRV